MSWSHDLSALSSTKKSVDWLNNHKFIAQSNRYHGCERLNFEQHNLVFFTSNENISGSEYVKKNILKCE